MPGLLLGPWRHATAGAQFFAGSCSHSRAGVARRCSSHIEAIIAGDNPQGVRLPINMELDGSDIPLDRPADRRAAAIQRRPRESRRDPTRKCGNTVEKQFQPQGLSVRLGGAGACRVHVSYFPFGLRSRNPDTRTLLLGFDRCRALQRSIANTSSSILLRMYMAARRQSDSFTAALGPHHDGARLSYTFRCAPWV